MAARALTVALCWAASASSLVSAAVPPLAPTEGLATAAAGDHLNHLILPRLSSRQLEDGSIPARVRRATQTDLDEARAVVKAAIAEAGVRNKARLDHPARNTYHAPTGSAASLQERDDGTVGGKNASFTTEMLAPPPQLLQVTDEVASAAALLAELGAVSASLDGSSPPSPVKRQTSNSTSGFWMEGIARKGSMPWGDDPSYQVFRNVRDFGARGDGVHDDTAAIRHAILAASLNASSTDVRCGSGSGGCSSSSTTKIAVVYFPAGTYLVSGTIPAVAGTQLIGDATDRPVLKAAPSFVGMGVISTDELDASSSGAEIQTTQQQQASDGEAGGFFRQIRNFVIDITAAPLDSSVCGVHYQVAQASSLQFVEVRAADPRLHPSTTQRGVFSENGMGGHISDLVVVGGKVGFHGGNSQFTAQRVSFRGSATAVRLVWDWGWVWKSVDVSDAEVGFRLANEADGDDDEAAAAAAGYLGSVYIMDSIFTNVGTAVLTAPASLEAGSGTTSITIDNVAFGGNVTNRVFDGAKEYVDGTPARLDTWTMGPLYLLLPERDLSLGYEFETLREASLLSSQDSSSSFYKKPYFERAKPQYIDVPATSWTHVKDFAKGDGTTDDTQAFQRVLDLKGHVFVDAGVYILTDTVTVHPGTVIVGEGWSQIAARGPKFSDPSNPRPMIKVGNKGDVGSVEMQDLLFTTKGATAGATMVEWNIKADESGRAGMWDCHVRIGGATGTDLTPNECPSTATGPAEACTAASLMLHVTSGASGYFENVWLWAADHMIDDSKMTPTSVYAARGLLVESQEPTWLYGTSAEHAAMYQYNFHGAKKLFAAMVQTESPFYQPQPSPSAPFSSDAVGVFPGDPDYSSCGATNGSAVAASAASGAGCDEAWAVIMRETSDIFVAGLSLYSWSSNNQADCIADQSCQNTLMLLENNTNVALHNLVSIGASNSLVADGAPVPAAANLAIDAHPRWSQLTVFYPIQSTSDTLACRDPAGGWAATPPNGKFRNADLNDGRRFFVSMVNGSPYRWTNYRKDSYQMSEFTFANVESGFSPQHVMKYGPGNFVDTNGEAYFRLEGTSKTFQVRGTTNDRDSTHKMRAKYVFDGMSANGVAHGSTHELRSRGGERAVNFVLTGSEKVGYWTSVNPPVAWMHAILPLIGARKLRHVSMLGSHNAGISYRNGGTIGPEAASLCQGVKIYDQLVAGSRWFDVRPVIGNGGQYLTGHYSGQSAPVFGINGQPLADIVSDINRFTEANGEVVIVRLSHAMNTDESYRSLNDAEWSRVFDIFGGLTRPCANLQGQIPDLTIDSLIGSGRACVIVLADQGGSRPDKGIYDPAQSFDFLDHWSDSNSASTMASDQTSWVRANRNVVADAGQRRDRFLIMQWIMTVQTLEVLFTAIEKYAVEIAYDALFWRAFSAFTPWSFPNVVLMDYVGILYSGDRSLLPESGEARAFVMAINVGLASHNCFVGGGTLD